MRRKREHTCPRDLTARGPRRRERSPVTRAVESPRSRRRRVCPAFLRRASRRGSDCVTCGESGRGHERGGQGPVRRRVRVVGPRPDRRGSQPKPMRPWRPVFRVSVVTADTPPAVPKSVAPGTGPPVRPSRLVIRGGAEAVAPALGAAADADGALLLARHSPPAVRPGS